MKNFEEGFFMTSHPKVDVDLLLYMFQEYEKGISFQYLIDTLKNRY
jgi:transposase